jgi:hypothetical protein
VSFAPDADEDPKSPIPSKHKGCTVIPDDGSVPQIFILAHQTIPQCMDVLAHELAHIAYPNELDDDHSERWQELFDWLYDETCRRMDAPESEE